MSPERYPPHIPSHGRLMPNPIRLILALHNHQPIGNFDHVFQQAYEDSYLPFLDVFSRYASLRIALHTSGSLMEWLDARHGEYVDRLAQLAGEGRIEILGGAFYEPILAMIPSRDRIGQIRSYSRWLQNRLGATVRGMWVPERVWEQSLARDLVDAGIEYTILDDFHFKMAGLTDAELTGHLLTEDEGRLLSVFPGSERLRYLIPFGSPRADDRVPGQGLRGAARRGGGLRRRRREVRHLAGDEEARLRRRLAGAVLRRPGGQPGLDPGDHAGRGDRQRAAAGQGLPARLQLSRDDRMGAAHRAVGRVRAGRRTRCRTIRAGRCCGGSCAAASGGTSRRSTRKPTRCTPA